jgi:hypothetical protein
MQIHVDPDPNHWFRYCSISCNVYNLLFCFSQAQEIWSGHQGGGGGLAGEGGGEERTPLLAPGGMLQRYIETGGTLYEG